ncbi:MAG: helix-turn-helix transcriptional regulator [Gammaproteobacteria bacterium]
MSHDDVHPKEFHDPREVITKSEISLPVSIPSLGLEAWRMRHNSRELEEFCLDTHALIVYQGKPSRQVVISSLGVTKSTQRFGELLIGAAGDWARFTFDGVEQDDFQMSFDPEIFGQLAEELGFDPDKLELRTAFGIMDPVISHIAFAMEAEARQSNPYGQLLIEGLGLLLIKGLILKHSSFSDVSRRYAEPAECPAAVRRCLDYLHAHFMDQQTVTLAVLARAANLSKFHLNKVFAKATGITPHQYLIRLRVDHAKGQLRNTRKSITEIAAEFNQTPSQFSTEFKKWVGVSPSVFRSSGK